MKTSEITAEMNVKLYNLTSLFTKKYVHRYYKQYRGDVEDLASEIYLHFITPKSRIKGQEKTLLERFDPSITTLEYLVKISVQRKLIDFSRGDKQKFLRTDILSEDFGDVFYSVFGLSYEMDENLEDEVDFEELKRTVEQKLSKMDSKRLEQIKIQFEGIKEVLEPNWKGVFESINKNSKIHVWNAGAKLNVDLYQITEKTICLLMGGKIIEFDKETGYPRNKKYKYIKIEEIDFERIQSMGLLRPKISREEFIKTNS